MKKKGYILGIIAVLVVAVVLLVNRLTPKPQEGLKNIEIKIVDEMNDEILYEGKMDTEAETLGEMLVSEDDLKVKGETGQYGFFISSMMGVDAHDDAFWVFESDNNKSCGEAEAGFCPAADAVVLADGDTFLFKLTNQFN